MTSHPKKNTTLRDHLQAAAELTAGKTREVFQVLAFELEREHASGITSARLQKMIAAAHEHVRQGPWGVAWGEPDVAVKRAGALAVVDDAGRRVQAGEPPNDVAERMLVFLGEHDAELGNLRHDRAIVEDLARDLQTWSPAPRGRPGRRGSAALLAGWIARHADALGFARDDEDQIRKALDKAARVSR